MEQLGFNYPLDHYGMPSLDLSQQVDLFSTLPDELQPLAVQPGSFSPTHNFYPNTSTQQVHCSEAQSVAVHPALPPCYEIHKVPSDNDIANLQHSYPASANSQFLFNSYPSYPGSSSSKARRVYRGSTYTQAPSSKLFFPKCATPLDMVSSRVPRPESGVEDSLFSGPPTPSSSPLSLSPIPVNPKPNTLSMDLPLPYADKISQIDQEVLKLLSERANMLSQAQQQQEGPRQSPQQSGKASLLFSRTGIPSLDAVFSKGNSLIFYIGHLKRELNSAMENLQYNCPQCADLHASIQYISCVLKPMQGLKLSTLQSGMCHLSLDSTQFASEGSKVVFYLDAVNALLKTAQTVTIKDTTIEKLLAECHSNLRHFSEGTEISLYTGSFQDAEINTLVRNICLGNTVSFHCLLQQWNELKNEARRTTEIITEGLTRLVK